jgi:hypothetical protein
MRYFSRLENRMLQVGPTDDDELLRLVREAYSKLHHLSVAIQYRSCANNVGRRPPDSRSNQ